MRNARVARRHGQAVLAVILTCAIAPAAAAEYPGAFEADHRVIGRDMWFALFDALDLRPEADRHWQASVSHWAAWGLQLYADGGTPSIRLALETPFVSWRVSKTTVLPGDEVVFQLVLRPPIRIGGLRRVALGPRQIVVFSRQQRKIALVARGCAPVVVLHQGASISDTDSPGASREVQP